MNGSGVMAVQREFADGEVVPGTRYRVMRPLGAGGMGSVYLVEHVELGKRFVLKALFREFASRKDLVARLRQEWRALARLDNPNIINVTDAGTSDNGVPFYVMERVEGETLSELLARDHALGIPRAIAIATSVLDGLSAAHEIGIVHRDVKPPNIFVVQGGGVKLLDFGIAKLADQSAEVITARGLAIGTPRHMSPEQARGKAVDARADLYAVGLVLFEMIAGSGPFDDARDANEMLIAHLTTPPPKLSSQNRAVEPALDVIVDKLLAKEPADRPKSAREVASQLRSLLLKKPSAPKVIVQTPTQRMEETPAAVTRRVGPEAATVGATLIQPVSAEVESITEPGAPPSSVPPAETTQEGMEWAKDGFDTHVSDDGVPAPSVVDSEEVTAVPRHDRGHTLRLGDAPIVHPADVETRTAVPAAETAPAAPLAETPPPVSSHLPASLPSKAPRSLVPLVVGAGALAALLAIASLVALKAIGGASSSAEPSAPGAPAPAPPPPAPVTLAKPADTPSEKVEPVEKPATTESVKPVESARPIAQTPREIAPKPSEPKVKPAEIAKPAAPKATAKPGKLPSSGL